MPKHTPSPHRFLAPAPPSTQKSKPKPQSSLRHGFTAQTPKPTGASSQRVSVDVGEERKVTPAKRFVIAPTQHAPNTSRPRSGTQRDKVDEAWLQTESTSRSRPLVLGRADGIDGSSPSSSATTAEKQDGSGVRPSIESSSIFSGEEEHRDQDDEDEMLFVTEEANKRRRVSPQPPSSPPVLLPARQSLHQPPQTLNASSHRFRVPAPKTPALFDNALTLAPGQATTRPHFILPRNSPSPSKSATPLPETFSPSRKTGKYIPSGLASTLQSWIIETANTRYTAQTSSAVAWGRDREDGVKVRVRITGVQSSPSVSKETGRSAEIECFPGGVVFVRGVTNAGLYNASRAAGLNPLDADEHGSGEIKVMLAGQGGARGKGGVRIRGGCVVGIRAPMWDVDVGNAGGEEKWLVGVEWVVLS